MSTLHVKATHIIQSTYSTGRPIQGVKNRCGQSQKRLTLKQQQQTPPRFATSKKASLCRNLTTKVLPDTHRRARSTLSSHPKNVFLNTKQPNIHDSVAQPPRTTKLILAQLRSGWRHRLNSYMSRINLWQRCPDCANDSHEIVHIFNCPANRTVLNVQDLWTKTKEIAAFLGLYSGGTTADNAWR